MQKVTKPQTKTKSMSNMFTNLKNKNHKRCLLLFVAIIGDITKMWLLSHRINPKNICLPQNSTLLKPWLRHFRRNNQMHIKTLHCWPGPTKASWADRAGRVRPRLAGDVHAELNLFNITVVYFSQSVEQEHLYFISNVYSLHKPQLENIAHQRCSQTGQLLL